MLGTRIESGLETWTEWTVAERLLWGVIKEAAVVCQAHDRCHTCIMNIETLPKAGGILTVEIVFRLSECPRGPPPYEKHREGVAVLFLSGLEQ